MSILKEYWGEMITFFTGGGLMALLSYLRDGKKDKIDEFEKVIEHWKSIMAEHKENERVCEERYELLHTQFMELQQRDIHMQQEISELRKKIDKLTKSIS